MSGVTFHSSSNVDICDSRANQNHRDQKSKQPDKLWIKVITLKFELGIFV